MSPTTSESGKPSKPEQDLQAVLAKIAGMPQPYASIGARLHEAIMSAGPRLKPRLWYGMPGYATGRSTPVIVFFRLDDGVFSLGLSEKANVDAEPGTLLRPCAWYLDDLDDATTARIADLVRVAFN